MSANGRAPAPELCADSARGRNRSAPSPRVLAGPDVAREVVRRVTTRVMQRAEAEDAPSLAEVVSQTIDSEVSRCAHDPSDPSVRATELWLASLRHEVVHAGETRYRELLYGIVDRYAREIEGHFDARIYTIATRAVPKALNALLRGFRAPETSTSDVDDRLLIEGEVDTLRRLANLGTVVLAPNHVSNLDSLVLGSAIYRMGLPPFAYGAGLNLFSNGPMSFFMRNLGAYTVDRKKTDPIYRETLKEYETILIERGQHTLFFPGGTRSRSGAVESHLKKGLLGTAPVALRHALAADNPRARVFIVPCTLTYPLVLEASSLIAAYLKAEGGPRYVDVRDEFDRTSRWARFLGGLLQLDARVHVRIGRPLDVVGLEVSPDGTSRNPRGRAVDTARYLLVDGTLCEDHARDAAYTGYVAAGLVAAYRRDTVALPTSVVAYAVFRRLRRECASLNLFRFLRSVDPSVHVRREDILADLDRLVAELAELERRGAIKCSPDLRETPSTTILAKALGTFATYHPVAIIEQHGESLHVGDASLLYYYRNRLEGYGLLESPADASPAADYAQARP